MGKKATDGAVVFCGVIVVLAAVNILTFRQYYFGNACFPWDFWKLYYAIIPFWTTAIKEHVLPQWVPFEAMGYPFFINLQSSFFYPPLWLFVLPGVQYSLHAAVVVQCLHVLWGAFGAFLLLRVLTNDWRSALFGALAYHFFGGFYSNAEHMDIVRAYAWLPWLFWATTVQRGIQIRNLLLPAIFYCVATASYPGNLISHSFLIAVYLFSQFYSRLRDATRRDVLIVFVLLALGLVLSSVAIGPPFLLRNQLSRATVRLPTASWTFPDWLSLIAPWSFEKTRIPGYVGGDISMISAFVGVPTVALIILIRGTTAKRMAVWWLLLILSVTFALGQWSTVYNVAVAIVPILGLSRMASSDYRGVTGLALIVLASVSLRDFLAANRDARKELLRHRFKYLCLLPLVVLSGVFGVFLPGWEIIWLTMVWAATVGVLCFQWSKHLRASWIFVGALCVLIIIGGWHVTSVSKSTWSADVDDVDDLYKRTLGFSTSADPLPIADKIHGVPSRPARTDRKRGDFSWSGYLDGTYQMSDWSNTVLKSRAHIETSAVLLRYMRLPSTPLIFPSNQPVSPAILRKRLSEIDSNQQQESRVVSSNYGVNTITYDVALPAESIVVENETWFPGWEGKLIRGTEAVGKVRATSFYQMLRAWRLPAGRYTFIAQYKTPYIRACALLSLIGLLIYLVFAVTMYRKWRASNMNRNPLSLDRDEESVAASFETRSAE